MNVRYVTPSPPPQIEGTDGLFTEIEYIRKFFGGSIVNLSPFRDMPPVIPVRLYGLQHGPRLWRNSDFGLTHIFFPYLVNFCVIKFLSTPLLYSITSGIEVNHLPRTILPFPKVVSSEHEADVLRSRDFTDVHVIRPGIDLTPFSRIPPPVFDEIFTIMAGSAPWTGKQFESKGFNLLLRVLSRIPELRLVCLFRGTLHEEWSNKVEAAGLVDRVEIIHEKTDVARILARCHAAIVLASKSDEVKSYPNSLMESLASGRPVLVSRVIPISFYIEDNDLGKVIEDLSLEALVPAVRELMDHYSSFRQAVDQRRRSDWSVQRMIEDYASLYRKVIE